jgi:hypothetical protein
MAGRCGVGVHGDSFGARIVFAPVRIFMVPIVGMSSLRPQNGPGTGAFALRLDIPTIGTSTILSNGFQVPKGALE